jgi:hypothetical protein
VPCGGREALNGIQDCGCHIVCDRYPEEHTVLFTGQYLSSSSALARGCISVESFLRPCQSLVSRVHNSPTSSWSSAQPFVCNTDIRVVTGRCTLSSTLGLRDRQMNRSKVQSDEPSGYEKSMPLPGGPRERAAVCAGDIRRLESCTLCRGSMFRLLSVSVGLLNRRISK